MDASNIELGTVFRFPHDDRPNRVLLHDGDVVMYDVWWPHLNGWGLADLATVRRKRIAYYVTTVATLVEKATELRSEPLSADEQTIHRPDLPFAPLQDAAIAWSSDPAERLTKDGSGLSAPAVYLSPFGPGGGTKPQRRVEAVNGSSFSAEELFGAARAVQAAHLGDEPPVTGVGIYRSGLQRGLPEFYLWGSVSRLHETLAAHQNP